MISFLRSSRAQQMAARRNHGIQERRVRLMQLGERAYLCREFQNETLEELRLINLPELELRQILSTDSSLQHPSRADLASALKQFADKVKAGHYATTIVSLEISQRIQELLEDVDRESFLAILSGLKNLRHITLGTITLEILLCFESSGCIQNVQSLHTECFHGAPEEEAVMVNLLSNWKSLKSLTWKTCSYRRAGQINMIANAVPSMPLLTHVHLGHTGLKEFHPFEALQFIQNCSQLEDLVLANWKLPTMACTVLADGIRSHAQLQRVVLSRCEIIEAGWDALMNTLKGNPVLREFSFPETRISRAATSSSMGGTYPTRILWERLAVLLQDYNLNLSQMENVNTLRVWRLLELNRSNFRRHINDDDSKLGPHILGMASHSPRFLFSILRPNVATLLVNAHEAST